MRSMVAINALIGLEHIVKKALVKDYIVSTCKSLTCGMYLLHSLGSIWSAFGHVYPGLFSLPRSLLFLELRRLLRLLLFLPDPMIRPYSSFRSSRDIGFKCMKLQNPARVHSPISYWRQQASLKSVTGDSSA